jgi:hypothetical protein
MSMLTPRSCHGSCLRWLGDSLMWLDQLLANPVSFSAYDCDTVLHEALVDFIRQYHPTHLATATLFHQDSMLTLEDGLNDWAIRVNRCYLGRRWHTSPLKDKALNAFMYIVRGTRNDDLHAALLVRPPLTADPSDFATRAPTFFALDFLSTFPPLGDMKIADINCDGSTDQTEQVALAFVEKLAGL